VADIEDAEKISVHHVAESLSYREGAAFGVSGWKT
jgi:predicted ATPase with chaperone activity